MSKKIISLLLAVMLTVSMVAVAAVSVSAKTDEQGRYTPSEGVESTNRYYFAMPQYWYSEYTDTAGIYWWEGSDACGAVDGSGGTTAWPGYKPQISDVKDVYYVDCPTDVSVIIWNNFVNGGEDPSQDIYSIAAQSQNASCEYYSDGDSDLYPTEFFEEMQKSYDGDKAALGNFADNFFDNADYGLSFTMDNMIFVIDPSQTTEGFNGKMNYVGDWYFYYGDGEFGTYPTKEAAAAAGTLQKTSELPEPTTAPVADDTTAPDTTAVVETTVPATEATASEPIDEDDKPYLTVNATSNYFPEATAEYNKETNEVKVTYSFKSSKDILDTQWYMYYDSKVLKVSSKNNPRTVCPTMGAAGGMLNLAAAGGAIKFNASNLGLYNYSTEKTVFAEVIFDVVDISNDAPVSTTIDLTVDVLRVSKIDPSTSYSDKQEEIILVDRTEVFNNESTATVNVEKDTKLTDSTYVPSTTAQPEPTTAVPTTTEEPTTAVPTTTEEPTSNPSSPYLTVTATSNYFPKAVAEYNEDTKEVTVTYTLKSSKDILDTQWYMYYDSSVLKVSSKNNPKTVCPEMGTAGAMLNLAAGDGVIKYNATNLGLYDFSSSEKVFAEIIFDVVDISDRAPVSTTINLDVDILRVSKIDPSTTYSDKNEEVILLNRSEVLDNEQTASVTVERRTSLTPSTYVIPTTVTEPDTTAPTTATEPDTTAPETTVAPDTTVPAPSQNATSATGSSVSGGSTNTPGTSNTPGGATGTGTGTGAVQTGDASLAVIILSLLVAATGVMFVLRKREMF